MLNLNNKVTTIEYNVPQTDNSKIIAKSYWDFETNDTKYDTIVTYSSIEHSGLGRYGDPLDPSGDIKTMKTIHKKLNNNGFLIWGAPVGRDALVWNAHRVYGRIRLPLMFDNFRELEWFGYNKKQLLNLSLRNNGCQPVIVLQKI